MSEGGFITVIPNVLDFTLVYNQGIAFGMLQGLGVWLAPVALAMTGFAYWLYTKRQPNDKMQALVAILVAGGAIGNVIDRLAMGRVTDFINIKIIPVFNFADASISIGVLTLVFFQKKLIHKKAPQPPQGQAA